MSIPTFRAGTTEMNEHFEMYQLDAVEFLNGLAPESVDLFIFDCAYESLEKHRAKGTTTRLKVSKSSSNEWFSIFKDERWPNLLQAMNRALKPNGHIYSFADQETTVMSANLVTRDMPGLGWKWWKWITWDKQRIGMGYHYRNRTECINFFEKGKRKLNDLGLSDVIKVDDLDQAEVCIDKVDQRKVDGGYPTEKPFEVALPLVLQSSLPGEVVCDPFGGSGAFGAAALMCGRRFIYNDISPAAHTYAAPRLAGAQKLGAASQYTIEQLKADLKRVG